MKSEFSHPRLRPLASNWHHEAAPRTALAGVELSRASLARLARLEASEKPYVRLASAPIPCAGSWSVDRPEPRKIFMPFSPPRFKMTRNGPREEKWLMLLESVTVTVTLPRGSYTLTATNRGNTVLDSRDQSRRPLAEVRRGLARVLGTEHADAACGELDSVIAGPRKPRAPKVRTVTDAEKATMEAVRNSWDAIEADTARRRRDRKANPPAKDAPNFAEMSAEEFAQFNAEQSAIAAETGAALARVRAGAWVDLN